MTKPSTNDRTCQDVASTICTVRDACGLTQSALGRLLEAQGMPRTSAYRLAFHGRVTPDEVPLVTAAFKSAITDLHTLIAQAETAVRSAHITATVTAADVADAPKPPTKKAAPKATKSAVKTPTRKPAAKKAPAKVAVAA